MKVGVFGLWHLGSVTSACLAEAGHDVVAVDPDAGVVAALRDGRPPIAEPGLEDLVRKNIAAGRLRFENDAAFSDVEVVWVTFDTPVDDNDVADVPAVTEPVLAMLTRLPRGCLVLVSSQLPVGTTRRLAGSKEADGRGLSFACSPENLRLGKAIEVFMHPERIVVGLQVDADRAKVTELLAPISDRILWVGLEAAEMIKHAINAFLAVSITFMNEIASIAETVGADAKEVEAGLKSEGRIGPKAYLSPGGAFAGGTLARDVTTLAGIAKTQGLPTRLIPAILDSNREHGGWALRKIREMLGSLSGKRVAVLGLTYKAGTSTLRRSSSVELVAALAKSGAVVVAFDPAISELPAALGGAVTLATSAMAAAANADVLVLSTEWPEFRQLDWQALLQTMAHRRIVDANRFLAPVLKGSPGVVYAAVGLPLAPRAS